MSMTRDEYLHSLQVMVTTILLYYYQGLSYILSTSDITVALAGFTELFNLNIFGAIRSSGSAESGFCLLQQMDMIQKITLQLTSCFFLLLFTMLPFLIGRIMVHMLVLKNKRCCCLRQRLFHFGKSLISAVLICVGQILSVLCKLLACRDVGALSVHYFYGAASCYDNTWFVAFASLCVLFACFLALFVWIWRRLQTEGISKDPQIRKQKPYQPVISRYREEVWFWESVLFLRRSVLALTFIVFDRDELKMCIGIALLLFQLVHQDCKPFKSDAENRLETYLIVATAICIFMDAAATSQSDDWFSNVVISLLILLPMVWCCKFACFNYKALGNNHVA
eukprot:CAMPEP_0202731210 /NCGR_PEP_ID=MMETSP1385-20130828/187033_1 /ASSEMBLY_ACC=CAM_ASM_000861 /TAXON_ID=933848 /ORGANISM="Elphidium margaritaceum" /LENGTH=336 /DNA_ID=CAMNT_0049397501 /DNA_START=219 /DNA_END=1225 /DNA_ORIENTATION=-